MHFSENMSKPRLLTCKYLRVFFRFMLAPPSGVGLLVGAGEPARRIHTDALIHSPHLHPRFPSPGLILQRIMVSTEIEAGKWSWEFG